MPAPWLSRRVVYPLHERLMQRPTFAYLESLEESQWLSRADLEGLQARKLTRLLQTAAKHSPWHTERIQAAGLDVGEDCALVTLEELRRLPVMTKQDAGDMSIGCVGRVPGGASRYNTGGSSGEPLSFIFRPFAAGLRCSRPHPGSSLVGCGRRGTRGLFVGAPAELNKTDRIKTSATAVANQLVLNAFAMSAANMDAYLDAVQRSGRNASTVREQRRAAGGARRCTRDKTASAELRVVCATGEPLYPHQRQLIEEIFGVPAANEFGSRDIGFTAHETPRGQMLLLSESILLEVLDEAGHPVAPGELGEAVATGLCSDAQPFIRYRTGDMVRMSPESCADGRGLHVLSEVVGRTTDFVVRPDGVIMHALAVIYVLRAWRELRSSNSSSMHCVTSKS